MHDEARIQMANSQNTNDHETQSNGQRMQTTVLRVNEHARDARKSNKAFGLMGQITSKKPPKWV